MKENNIQNNIITEKTNAINDINNKNRQNIRK